MPFWHHCCNVLVLSHTPNLDLLLDFSLSALSIRAAAAGLSITVSQDDRAVSFRVDPARSQRQSNVPNGPSKDRSDPQGTAVGMLTISRRGPVAFGEDNSGFPIKVGLSPQENYFTRCRSSPVAQPKTALNLSRMHQGSTFLYGLTSTL